MYFTETLGSQFFPVLLIRTLQLVVPPVEPPHSFWKGFHNSSEFTPPLVVTSLHNDRVITVCPLLSHFPAEFLASTPLCKFTYCKWQVGRGGCVRHSTV